MEVLFYGLFLFLLSVCCLYLYGYFLTQFGAIIFYDLVEDLIYTTDIGFLSPPLFL